MILLATALLALLPQPQEREPVLSKTPAVPPLVVRVVNGLGGAPVTDLRLRVRGKVGPLGEELEEDVVTDSSGTLHTTAGFERGSILLSSLENEVGDKGRNFGGSRTLRWDGRDETIVAWPMPKYEIDARFPGGAPLAEVTPNLQIKARVEYADFTQSMQLGGGGKGTPYVANLRLAGETDALPWARFESRLFGPGLSREQRESERSKWEGVDILDAQGFWSGHSALPEDGQPLVFEMERTATLKCLILDANMDLRENLEVVGRRSGTLDVTVILSPTDESDGRNSIGTKGLKIAVGEELKLGWLSPGRWTIRVSSMYFQPTVREITLVAGENVLDALVLGERIAIGSVGVKVFDWDGDMGRGSGGVQVDSRISIRAVDDVELALDGHHGNWGDDWPIRRLEGESGAEYRWKMISNLSDREYSVSISSNTRYAIPRVTKVRLGGTAEFTLKPLDSAGSYWVSIAPNESLQTGTVLSESLDPLDGTQFRMGENRECFVSGPLGEGDNSEWCLFAPGFKRIYLAREDFERDGDRLVGHAFFELGWSEQIRFNDQQGRPVPGVSVQFEGAIYISDHGGLVRLESSFERPAGGIAYKYGSWSQSRFVDESEILAAHGRLLVELDR